MDESGWLIEGVPDANGVTYVGVVGGLHKNFAIVYDASAALRLSRRIDAQALIDNVPWFRANGPFTTADHCWPNVGPQKGIDHA